MTARIDRNRLFEILALDGQGSDAYLADQLEARMDEWLVESTAPVPVEPVLDLDTLERVIHAAKVDHPHGVADGALAAAVERHVAPILAAARRGIAPTDTAKLAKDPKVAAAVLRAEGAGRAGPDGRVWRTDECDRFLARADQLDPPEPVDPPMVVGQWRQLKGLLWQRQFSEELYGPWRWTTLTGQVGLVGYRSDEEMRGCRVVPAAEVITRLGLGGEQ